MSYLVTVSTLGKTLKTFYVPLAESGLDACTQTEKKMKLKPPFGTVNPDTGSISHCKWHGYFFAARAMGE